MLPGEAPRAYVDAPITDRAAADRAARHAAQQWCLGAPQLVRVGMNAIYVVDDVMLRVSAPNVDAAASLALHDVLSDAGLRVPEAARTDVIEHAGLSVTAWERIGESGASIDWHDVGVQIRRVHELDPNRLPAEIPLPRPTSFPWWDFELLLERTATVLDDGARRGLEAAIELHRDWSAIGGEVVCHGDLHPGNVMMTVDGPVLIDWDLLCWARPGWDHGPMLTWADRWGGAAEDYPAFADGYGASLADDPSTRAFAELRLVAATLMRLAAGMRDPAAMPEAQRRLVYWRGDADAPMWAAQ